MIAAFPFTTAWVFFSGEKLFPPGIDWLVVSGMIILGSFGYLLLITSLRLGELSAIMPFRYSRIVFLLILGVLVFGERPTASMLVGATLILISGVYIMWREKVVKSGLGTPSQVKSELKKCCDDVIENLSASKREVSSDEEIRQIATVSANGDAYIGGLISENNSDTDTQVPWLGDLPILGNLFKNTAKSKVRTELIVMITPKIIADEQDIKDIKAALQPAFSNLSFK